MADLVEDIETIVGELVDAYDNARAESCTHMTLKSAVGARFEERVRRVSDAIYEGRINAKSPPPPKRERAL